MNVSSAVERLMAEGIKENKGNKDEIVDPKFPGVTVKEPETSQDHLQGKYCKVVVEDKEGYVSVTTIVKVNGGGT